MLVFSRYFQHEQGIIPYYRNYSGVVRQRQTIASGRIQANNWGTSRWNENVKWLSRTEQTGEVSKAITLENLNLSYSYCNVILLHRLFTESGKPATVDLQHPDLHAEHFKHAHEHHKDPVAKMLATKPEDDLDPETHRMYDKIMADMPPPPRVLSPDTTVPWCIQLVATYRHILDAHHNGLR